MTKPNTHAPSPAQPTPTSVVSTIDPASSMLTRPQLAARWQCSTGHLANLASASRGPSYLKIGSSVRYRLSVVEAYEAVMEVRTIEASTMGLSA